MLTPRQGRASLGTTMTPLVANLGPQPSPRLSMQSPDSARRRVRPSLTVAVLNGRVWPSPGCTPPTSIIDGRVPLVRQMMTTRAASQRSPRQVRVRAARCVAAVEDACRSRPQSRSQSVVVSGVRMNSSISMSGPTWWFEKNASTWRPERRSTTLMNLSCMVF
jgi:hypothetical protein